MKIHYLQHVPFEDPANIAIWARDKGYDVTRTLLCNDEELPESVDDFDWLVIMGGPMGTYDEDKHPWLKKEKVFIKKAIDAGKVVLGVCLGAQLIAEALGSKVFKNKVKEIGWYPVTLDSFESKNFPIFKSFPKQFMSFHWHGDTFELPKGCTRIASTPACWNQAFQYKDRVIGLQFHLEFAVETIQRLICHCEEELHEESPYIQQAEEMLGQLQNVDYTKSLLFTFLDNIEKHVKIS